MSALRRRGLVTRRVLVVHDIVQEGNRRLLNGMWHVPTGCTCGWRVPFDESLFARESLGERTQRVNWAAHAASWYTDAQLEREKERKR